MRRIPFLYSICILYPTSEKFSYAGAQRLYDLKRQYKKYSRKSTLSLTYFIGLSGKDIKIRCGKYPTLIQHLQT